MKKIFLSILLVFSSFAFSQKPSTQNPFSIEGQLRYNNASLQFNTPAVRMRYFIKDDISARLTVLVDNSADKDVIQAVPGSGGSAQGHIINKISNLIINLGGEKHLKGTDKLSPYLGSDVLIGFGNSKRDLMNTDGFSWIGNYTEKSYAPHNHIGLNIVGGTDYYFKNNFYAGLELGIGFIYTNYQARKTVIKIIENQTTTLTPPSQEFSLSNNFIGNFRLGWRF
jgi:hypothetical protein